MTAAPNRFTQHRRHCTWGAALRALMLPLAFSTAVVATAQDLAVDKDPSRQVQTPFAPGVLTLIPPAPQPEETFSGPFDLNELLEAYPELDWKSDNHPEGTPHFGARSRTLVEMAKEVTFRRDVYCLEFAFKPLRQILMDLPRPDGGMQRKVITYMVFRLRYRGGDLRPAADKIGDGDVYRRVESVSYPSRRAFPLLKLTNHETGNSFVDKILPTAKTRIAAREQITAPLYNTVEISRVPIEYSKDPDAQGVWGVATWTDVDPDVDFFSVDIFGLTLAFQQDDLDPQAPYRRKALSLNFYRPGDAMAQTEDRVRFGVPALSDPEEQAEILDEYGLEERLDYRWVFR